MSQPTPQLKDIIEYGLQKAGEIVMQGDQAHRIFFAVDNEKNMNFIMAPKVGTEDDERNLLSMLRVMFAVMGVTQYAMVTEAWTVESAGTDREKATRIRPSEHPDRKEVLFAIAVRRVTGESGQPVEIQSIARRAITRDPTAVGDIEWPEYQHMDGRMINLLPPHDLPPIPSEMREALMRKFFGEGHTIQRSEWKH